MLLVYPFLLKNIYLSRSCYKKSFEMILTAKTIFVCENLKLVFRTPRSRTPSVNTVTVRKSALALPILKYARPQLAIQKEMLHYSDLPLLR